MKLRLSPHVLPQVRQGLHDLVPQNLAPGEDRRSYAMTLVSGLVDMAKNNNRETAKAFREDMMFGARMTTWTDNDDGTFTIEPLPELENAVCHNPEQLGVLFRDGRIRDDGAMVYLPTGESTPLFADLLWRLHRGIDRAELMERAETLDIGFDEELLEDLIARGVIEPGESPAPSAATFAGMTWMGHAFVMAANKTHAVWFDPFSAPRLQWTDEEKTSMFPTDVPDSFLLPDYGPTAHQITQDELPIPDAVFITHQDTDHLDLGVLSLLPPTVPIYVPDADPSKPWLVDLVTQVRAIIGPDRNVKVLKWNETVTFGDMKVTPFPFIGEFPTSLPHTWNCYLVELPDQVWAMCADSSVTETQVDWLRERLGTDPRPFGIMVNGIINHRTTMGYRDVASEPYSFARLYTWYMPALKAFEPAPACGLPTDMIKRLVAEAGLSKVYLYAHGGMPWFRLKGTHLHHTHVGSHSMGAFTSMESTALAHGARVVRLQHGVSHVGAEVSVLPRRK